jgi:putative ABC transport system permease protein
MIAVLGNAVMMALRELARNFTRTALTSLGILIGVAAVIAMVGLGRGATAAIEGDLASMGVNLILVFPGTGGGPQRASAPPFTLADARAIADQVPHVGSVAPMANVNVAAVHGDADWATSVQGSTRGWLPTLGRKLASGRVFTEGEERAGAPVCVVGETVARELFHGGDPLDQQIRLGAVACTIIGVLAPEGQNTMGMDQDNLIWMPITTVHRRLAGTSDVGSIFVSADAPSTMGPVAADVEALLRERRGITTDDAMNFMVSDTRELADRVGGVTAILTTFLAAVAGVSLLVGGIGIMNIMLVSVTERTREIGVRMSIGALERDVMTQFLVEAAVLATFGGVLGVIVGVTGTWIGATLMGIPFVADPLTVVLAVGFSGLMGIGFGFWPARRAARLEPIDALRHT